MVFVLARALWFVSSYVGTEVFSRRYLEEVEAFGHSSGLTQMMLRFDETGELFL